jgi:hypothetical protein
VELLLGKADDALSRIFLTSNDRLAGVVPGYWMPCALAASVGEGGNNTAPAVSRESLLRFQESFPMRKTTKRGTAKRNPQTCNLSPVGGA